MFAALAAVWPARLAWAAPPVRALAAVGSDCWAVGDAGLVLRSGDGGKTWKPVGGHVTAQMDLSFLNQHRGVTYIFGGQGTPGQPDGVGRGVVLRMGPRDTELKALISPPPGWIHGGAMGGEGGVVFGQAVGGAGGGLWRTTTGGKLWSPLPVASKGYVAGGVFRTPFYGFVLGAKLRVISLRNLSEPKLHPPLVEATPALKAAAMVTPDQCWAVGESGTVLRSREPNQPWPTANVRLPIGTRRLADFEAIASDQAGRAWIGGGMLGVIVYTPDNGRTWEYRPAPCEVRALAHLEGEVLLAGGDMGQIWRSEDGGKTWTLRHGKPGTDVLVIGAATDRTLWPAALAAAVDGKQVAAVFVTHPDDPRTPPYQWLRAAGAQAGMGGVTVLNDFPSLALSPGQAECTAAEVLAHWSASLDTAAEPVVVRQLVAAIRRYRPKQVILGVPDAGPKGYRGENRLVARLALRALAEGVKDGAYKELASLGLAAHRPGGVLVAEEETETWCPPWTPQAVPHGAGRVYYDLADWPDGIATNLEMLVQRAMWQLPWIGLTDRPSRLAVYRVPPGEAYPAPAPGSRPRRGRVRRRAIDATLSDLTTCATLRLADRTGRVQTVLPALVKSARAVEPGEKGQPPLPALGADLAADRILLVWTRLLALGRLPEARRAVGEFLLHGRGHPLYARVQLACWANGLSSEWRAQRLRLEPPAPMASGEIQAALRTLGGRTAWQATPEGLALRAKLLSGGGRGPQAKPVLRALAAGDYPPAWRQWAQLELSGDLKPSLVSNVQLAQARLMTGKGSFDGKLDEPFWEAVESHYLRTADGKRPDRAYVGAFKVMRSAAGFVVFGLGLPKADGRRWEVDLAVDADRDGWTQLVLRFDSAGKQSAWLRTRQMPPVQLDKATYSIRGHDGEAWTMFEVGLGMDQVGQDPRQAQMWRLQVRAVAREGAKATTLYFQPQPDPRLLPHRYGLLHIPPAPLGEPARQ